MTDTFSALVSPKSVALVGASEDVARIGGRPLRYLREAGFGGSIMPVNPKRETVQGLTCHPDIASLPEVPDTAILAVPARATLDTVHACLDKGVKSAVIFSAGFAETGADGQRVQEEIANVAREGGLRLLGPNCLGVMNPAKGYYGTFSVVLDNALLNPGVVGIVSQSGAYGAHIAHLARARNMGISQWITTGNECDVDVSEALDWMVQQPETRVVMAYAEGVRDYERFIDALEKAQSLGKAIVFMKTGRSSAGAVAAASHTAALAGSDSVFDAVLRQYGAHRAASTAEQIDVAYACATGNYPTGNKVGIFTLSGGFGIQLADDAESAGLDVAPMPDDAQIRLKEMLPYSAPRNPVDATAQAVNDLDLLTRYVRAMMAEGGYDLFAGILGTAPTSKTFAEPLKRAFLAAMEGQEDKLRALTITAPADVVRTYEDDGFLVFEDGKSLAGALSALCRFAEGFARFKSRKEIAPAARLDLGKGPLSEARAKEILSRAGLDFPPEILVPVGGDVAGAAATLGYPVVLKVCSADIAHKTEVDGVAVNIRTPEDAVRAAEKIERRVREERPDARLDGILVAPMVGDGVEIIAGVTHDPVLGPVVLFGLGGVFVEVLKDVTFRAAPFDIDEAHRMIRDIRGFPMLEGVRGAPPCDVDALARMLSDLSRFAAAHADRIESIDLNPVRVMPQGQGVMPLDALIILKEEDSR
ncbi:pimeloyl-CoA synthetase [Pseudooceanicola batsensis HTCC2597]|uniref:Pimeloyl-CoA synthetase n=1 Tax=Pseudooceanicola batsensis (strain ATCC BAA-863 / DSM 15984 / KCTC 12145 / HTCC2597) TaxID=252305 RepID=A3U146_PSEBH|nr:acetate--CoA ligase family protein [Pseudooceanicola batsensis]EAQ02029.1 pimeloyl-CoA synthetase [Pseudooceanicola batsensis HTCC2597]